MNVYKPIILVILDGWGENSETRGNAIKKAFLPTIEKLNRYYPKLLLQASGISVGVPYGEQGNSEVGHQAIGSGQIIYQGLPRINMAIERGAFEKNPAFLDAINFVKKNNSSLHLMGLLSDGGVHSHIDHLFALMELIQKEKVKKLFIHIITDGRDTPSNDGIKFVQQLNKKINQLSLGKIATISGRYYAMDRNKNYERIKMAYLAMVNGQGIKSQNPIESIKKQYEQNIGDEYLKPIVVVDENKKPISLIKDDDAIIFFNYREDRARQITEIFVDEEIKTSQKIQTSPKIKFVGMVQYEKNLRISVAFPPQKAEVYLGKVLSENNKKQLRIAETEKYAHVTYFFNAGHETPSLGEDRILVPSKNSYSYDQMPEMSAEEITEKLIEAIDKDTYDFILVNYANPDMVGHTGNLKAAIKAVEKVDECLGQVIKATLGKSGCLLITADHGNVEEMIDIRSGEKLTEHTTNPVPFWFITIKNHSLDNAEKNKNSKISGMLSDIAPTILDLMKIKKPPEMTGKNLLEVI